MTSKNIFVISIHYGKKKIPQKHNSFNNKIVKPSIHSLRKQKIYNSLGLTSSFLKQFRSSINYSFQLIRIIKKNNIGVILWSIYWRYMDVDGSKNIER